VRAGAVATSTDQHKRSIAIRRDPSLARFADQQAGHTKDDVRPTTDSFKRGHDRSVNLGARAADPREGERLATMENVRIKHLSAAG